MTKGERIKHRREQLGISQTELAECIGTSKQNLYKYENDIITNIPSDRVEALAKKLNTSPAYIMGWNEDTSLPSPTSENTVSPPCSACDEDASIGDTTAANHTEDEYMPYFPNYMRIGKRIAKTRKEKGLSQKDLAKLIQVNPSTLSLWEGGKQVPPLSMARQLSKILTVDEKYLLGSSAPTIDSIEPSNQLDPSYSSLDPTQREIGLHEMYNLLIALGLIPEGIQLSEDDFNFISHILEMLRLWFKHR